MNQALRRGVPVVLAAPSGSGKTSIARALVASERDFVFSVSVTTRRARPGERDGVDYGFVDTSTFDAMVRAGELCEWAEVHGNRYGTPLANIEAASARGEHVVLDIDVQGARQIRASGLGAVLIFVLPPSAEVLLERLTGRGTEAAGEVARRLKNAHGELEAVKEFDYAIVNDTLEQAVRDVVTLVRGDGDLPPRAVESVGLVAGIRKGIDEILAERYAVQVAGNGHGNRNLEEKQR